jgi:hypothetical protein
MFMNISIPPLLRIPGEWETNFGLGNLVRTHKLLSKIVEMSEQSSSKLHNPLYGSVKITNYGTQKKRVSYDV